MAQVDDVFPLIGGLPDAPAFSWTDGEREPQVAIRYGHPGNMVWKVDGYRYSAEDLLAIIGTSRVWALDYRADPQMAPSEYRH